MEQSPFTITCTTCQTRLSVRDASLIGAILPCPKCGSMVQIVAPPPSPVGDAAEHSARDTTAKTTTPHSSPELTQQAVSPPSEEPVASRSSRLVPPPLPSQTAGADQEASLGESDSSASTASWASPTELLWRKWLLRAGIPMAALVLVAGILSMVFSPSELETPAIGPEVQETVEASDAPVVEPPKASRIEPRWIPDQTQLVFSATPSKVSGQSGAAAMLEAAGPFREPMLGGILEAFSLRLDHIRRVTWAVPDLAAWPNRGVVLIETEDDTPLDALSTKGKPIELALNGAACRQGETASWPHPFAVIDDHALVTGDADTLRGLADRAAPQFASATIARLLATPAVEANATVLLDLVAARKAGWPLPGRWLDVWPAGGPAWRVLWETPRGLGLALRLEGTAQSQWNWDCDDAKSAETVKKALDQLVPAAKTTLDEKAKKLAEDKSADARRPYGLFLAQAAAALDSAQWKIVETAVHLEVNVGQDPSGFGLAALESRPAIRADWSAAALSIDNAKHKRIVSALLEYERAEGAFPAGAVGGGLLPPETRLSWIATILPYCGHRDWHEALGFGYSWNGEENREIARRPLDEVINPALGPGASDDGFPVTHYVGVAGVGKEAGKLPADDPAAGVFNFANATRLSQIRDGASNTIAVLGVSGRLGPWASGGPATARGLTERPYVNGPDGFGSGQPDGMLAGMADGSVRFLSKDVDPRVLEQLATIQGGDAVPADALAPGKPEQPAPVPPAAPPAVEDKPASENKPVEPDNDAVKKRLAQPIVEIHFDATPLAEAIAVLEGLGAIRVEIAPAVLTDHGVSLDEPVTLRLANTTVGDALSKILAEWNLSFAVNGQGVVVTSKK